MVKYVHGEIDCIISMQSVCKQYSCKCCYTLHTLEMLFYPEMYTEIRVIHKQGDISFEKNCKAISATSLKGRFPICYNMVTK